MFICLEVFNKRDLINTRSVYQEIIGGSGEDNKGKKERECMAKSEKRKFS
jgi:hypothetical protein